MTGPAPLQLQLFVPDEAIPHVPPLRERLRTVPRVAQRMHIALKRTDEDLKAHAAREIRRLR